MAVNYKEYLDDALFAKNMTVTYKMLSFKEKVSCALAQQALEAYMKENAERVCGLYLTKPTPSTFSLESTEEINTSSEPHNICHIYSITSKPAVVVKKEEEEEERKEENSEKDKLCKKTWESDKVHVFTPLLSNKTVASITENPLLFSAFGAIEPPRDEISLKPRPVYAHDPAPQALQQQQPLNKSASAPTVKLEKTASTNLITATERQKTVHGSSSSSSSSSTGHLTKAKTADLSSLFSKSVAKRKSGPTVKPESGSAKKPKLKRLKRLVNDDNDEEEENSDDEDGGEEEDEECQDNGFFDNDDDDGFLDDDNDMFLPIKHESSGLEAKKSDSALVKPPPPPPQQQQQQQHSTTTTTAAPSHATPAKPQPPKKKSAPTKKKSGSSGTQTSISSFFGVKK